MRQFTVSPAGRRDLQQILEWTQATYGSEARSRYRQLLECAIIDIAADPERSGSQTRSELAAGVRTYHLMFSRSRSGSRDARVKRPRHFLLYRVNSRGKVEIARVLHESMDLRRHLPEDFASDEQSADES